MWGGRCPDLTIGQHQQPHRVPHLGERRHTTPQRRIEQVVNAVQFPAGGLDVVSDAGDPRLPGQRVEPVGVPWGPLQIGDQVPAVGHLLQRQGVQPAEADQPLGHP